MIEQSEPTPESVEKSAQEKFDAYIAASDEQFDIENFSDEDTLKRYYIRRTDGSVEQWFLVGQGPEKGKFESRGKKGEVLYKYIDLAKLEAQQADLSMEYMISRAKAVTDLGSEANEAVPVIGPNQALINEVPSFSSPQTPAMAQEGFSKPVESAASVEKTKYDYLRDFLPPVIRPSKEAQTNDQRYDSLLNGRDEDMPWNNPQSRGFGHYEPETEDDKKRKYYDRFVTPENRQEALGTLTEAMKATPQIREVLQRYGLSTTSIESVDAIRENPDVRFEVAKVLAEKLDRLAADPYNDMGWRINENSRNNLKADAITGRKMPSRVYAVDMALKMIGGEFASRLEGRDTIDRNEDGKVIVGQHRHAAQSALMSYF